MSMLAERVDLVIGVDTHTDTHTAVFCTSSGGVLATVVAPTTEQGLADLLDAAIEAGAAWPAPRVAWALEGAGSYGAGLRDLLLQAGQDVVEVTGPPRARGTAKNDELDARGIARAALATERPGRPRRGDTREALRLHMVARSGDVRTRTRLINQLKAIILTAPAPIRDKFRGASTSAQTTTASRMRTPTGAAATAATLAAVAVLKATAAQITALTKAITAADKALAALTTSHAPALLAQPGIGPVTAAQLLIAFSHPGRFPHEAAFARLAGVAPKEASSGRTVRHRLDRGGDRQLNAALHRIVLTRRRVAHPATTTYTARREAQGKTPREINRCLKRALARHLYKIMNDMPAMP
jgi:transposase